MPHCMRSLKTITYETNVAVQTFTNEYNTREGALPGGAPLSSRTLQHEVVGTPVRNPTGGLLNMRRPALLLGAVLALLASSPSSSQTGEQVALVMGNGAYQVSPLRNPPNDARAMAAALRECGFEVIERIDSDQRTMDEAIREFGRRLSHGGVGVCYYAGHGMQVDGRNYLIPVGADIQAEDEVKYRAVDAGIVLGKMESAASRVNIVILDACRDNPFARSFRTSARGLKRMDAPIGSFIAYATSPGGVAADGAGRYGLYTSNLHLEGAGAYANPGATRRAGVVGTSVRNPTVRTADLALLA